MKRKAVSGIIMNKIVILDAKTISDGKVDISVLSELGELVVYDFTKPCQVAERVADADYVSVCLPPATIILILSTVQREI